MKIKPNTLCMLRAPFGHAYNGRTVTAVSFIGYGVMLIPGGEMEAHDLWSVEAPWLETGHSWAERAAWLIPLSDPDADLTETQDMQDNLLAVLPFTRSTDPAGESLLEGEMA